MIKLYNDDCLKVMDKLIEDNVKVSAIITDIPYGTTACKWDIIIPFDEMWLRIEKLRKDKCAVVLFGSEPFSSRLRTSNLSNFKYDWIWQKQQGANFMNMKYQPNKIHENISVFYNHNYYPIMITGQSYYKSGLGFSKIYNTEKEARQNYGTRNPKSILKYNNSRTGYHPTQKPVDLLKYLIKTYTKKHDTVLDFTAGSGSTGIACKLTDRNFIGIELDKGYYDIAKKRIENTKYQYNLFEN